MGPVPLFPGVPGGPELLVVLLLVVAFFGVPVVLAVIGWRYVSDDDQVAELEARVRELESRVGPADGRDNHGGDDSHDEHGGDSHDEHGGDSHDSRA